MVHEHSECKHENLKYCPICQVVYCEDCKKEWRDQVYTYPYYYPIYPYTQPYITYKGVGDVPVYGTITVCSHSLDK
jgi:hypothetical protein